MRNMALLLKSKVVPLVHFWSPKVDPQATFSCQKWIPQAKSAPPQVHFWQQKVDPGEQFSEQPMIPIRVSTTIVMFYNAKKVRVVQWNIQGR